MGNVITFIGFYARCRGQKRLERRLRSSARMEVSRVKGLECSGSGIKEIVVSG